MSDNPSPERCVYNDMRRRCYCVTNKDYNRYGGRGIKICDRWMLRLKGFRNFLADMGPRPTPKHMIDRIDNDLGYSPDNCRWALMKEQVRNREKTLRDVDGTPIADIAERNGLKYMQVYSRYRAGKRGSALLSTNPGEQE